MPVYSTNPEQQVAYDDLKALIVRNKNVPLDEVLAIAANIVGMLIAMQDERSITVEQAMEIVTQNIALGNEEVIRICSTEQGVGQA